jgi:high-affinity Fe2+/Pb2+ permease
VVLCAFDTREGFDESKSVRSEFIVLAAVGILVIVVLAWVYVRKRRSTTASLRQKFGPEYERAVQKHGSERKAEAKLADRQERVRKLNIRDLDPMER